MSEHRLDDGLLVLRCQRGDPEAFREIVEGWEPRLYYYLRRILTEEDAVWDVLQETWLAVFRGVRTLGDVRRFPAWLYRIGRAKAVDHMRRQKRWVETLDEPAVDCAEDASTIAAAGDDAEFIHEQLGKLRPIHREVLTLRFLEDFSIREMSAILDVSEGTVRSRLHYAKKELSPLLRKTKYEDA